MKKLVTALLVLFSGYNVYSMGSLGAKLGQWPAKSIAKKGFSGFMTGLHWIIAAGLPIGYGGVGIYTLLQEQEFLKQLQGKDPKTVLFSGANELTTQCILSKLNTIQDDSVKGIIVTPNPILPICCLHKTIIMDDNAHEELHQTILENDYAKQNKWLTSFEHEISHIRNSDMIKRYTIALTLPLITHITYKKISNFIPSSTGIKSFGRQQAMKIPSAFGKLALTLVGISTLGHYQEQRADDEVSNNLTSLNSLKNFLQDFEKDEKQAIEEINNDPNWSMIRKKATIFAGNAIDHFFHPSTESRIAKLDQRIEKLEKSQTQLAKEDSA